jgi:hypothetical protein
MAIIATRSILDVPAHIKPLPPEKKDIVRVRVRISFGYVQLGCAVFLVRPDVTSDGPFSPRNSSCEIRGVAENIFNNS